MGINLRGRSVLKIADFSEEEILYLLDLAEEFKRLKLTGTDHKYLSGKNIVLLFEKTSTRTRSSLYWRRKMHCSLVRTIDEKLP